VKGIIAEVVCHVFVANCWDAVKYAAYCHLFGWSAIMVLTVVSAAVICILGGF